MKVHSRLHQVIVLINKMKPGLIELRSLRQATRLRFAFHVPVVSIAALVVILQIYVHETISVKNHVLAKIRARAILGGSP